MASFIPPGTGPDYLASIFGTSGDWSSWNGAMLLIALISFTAVTVLYMLAVAFNSQTLKTWCKGEYLQVIVTFLLAGSIVTITAILWPLMLSTISYIYNVSQDPSLSGGLPGGGGYYDPFDFAAAYIEQVLLGCSQVLYRVAYAFNAVFEPIQGLSLEILGAEPAGGWYASLYTGFFKYLATNISNLALLHWVQIRFLGLIKFIMPGIIMMGLVLRAFPFTRGAGGLMLAIGFGFFFVYPVSITMLLLLQPLPDQAWCTSFTPPAALDPAQNDMTMLTKSDITGFAAKVSIESDGISTFIEKAKNFITVFYMQAMFFPLVALIMTFTFIRQTGAVFGADLGEIGRGLIKLI